MIPILPTLQRDTYTRAEAMFMEMEQDLDMSPYIISKLKRASGFTTEGLLEDTLFTTSSPKTVIYHWHRQLKDSTPNKNALPAFSVLEDILTRHGLPDATASLSASRERKQRQTGMR